MSDTQQQAAVVSAKMEGLKNNRAVGIIMLVTGICLALLIAVLAIIETIAYFAYCGFYGETALDSDVKSRVIPGEVFFTTLLVLGGAYISLAATVFCSVVVMTNSGSEGKGAMIKKIAFICCLFSNTVALTIMVVQSANFGGQARLLQDSLDFFCNASSGKDRKNCFGMINSMWTIFAGCVLLVFSVFFNLIFNVVAWWMKKD